MIKAFLSSPIGAILLEEVGAHLTSIRILPIGEAAAGDYGRPLPGSLTAEAARQLTAYFDGQAMAFDLPLVPVASIRGQALRDAIAAIPLGETLSYGALARIAGSGPRAIGQACARNPFPIVIPCHRVIGSGGALGHYSGGSGIITKRWLLDHERRGGLL
jgi:methylated-DNA-[protein]-cysteine S-methyltransferase